MGPCSWASLAGPCAFLGSRLDIPRHLPTPPFPGLKSLYEAMFQGVPLVGVPFVIEQLSNVQRAAARGMGLALPEAPATRRPHERISREGLAALVRRVCGLRAEGLWCTQAWAGGQCPAAAQRPVPRCSLPALPCCCLPMPSPQVMAPSPYASAARRASAALQLAYAQRRPLDRAADEVELALLHGGYSLAGTPPAGAAAAPGGARSGVDAGDAASRAHAVRVAGEL